MRKNGKYRSSYFERVRETLNGDLYQHEDGLLTDRGCDAQVTNMLLVRLIDEVRAVRQKLSQLEKRDHEIINPDGG